MCSVEFQVWYRHSGQDEIPEIPSRNTILETGYNMKTVKDYRAILRNIRSNYITHMYVNVTNVVPPLEVIAPRLTHLRVYCLEVAERKLDW